MSFVASLAGKARFFITRLRERIWVKPLMISILSILAAFLSGLADSLNLSGVPEISKESIETLLEVLSASMLVIAVFALGAMLSAYASASSAATPRAFAVIISDDVSQNALSTFIGAFIFGIIALIALQNGYYGITGRFALFLLTVGVFGAVVLGFVRWADRIARLGRLGTIVDKIEASAAKALRARARSPTLGARPATRPPTGLQVHARKIGYVQHIDVARLQRIAERHQCQITVAAVPGTFAAPGQVLAFVDDTSESTTDLASCREAIIETFVIDGDRTFHEDPRFGLVVLAETALRALSPAVNDPGTAIDIIGTLVRLFAIWADTDEKANIEFDRITIPELAIEDMFDDAFSTIARDGAGMLEVIICLLKGLEALSSLGDEAMRSTAAAHARYVVRHAELALRLPEDLAVMRATAAWAVSPPN